MPFWSDCKLVALPGDFVCYVLMKLFLTLDCLRSSHGAGACSFNRKLRTMSAAPFVGRVRDKFRIRLNLRLHAYCESCIVGCVNVFLDRIRMSLIESSVKLFDAVASVNRLPTLTMIVERKE